MEPPQNELRDKEFYKPTGRVGETPVEKWR